MQMTTPQLEPVAVPAVQAPFQAHYLVLGVSIGVRAWSAEAFARVDETYAAFRQAGAGPAAFTAALDCAAGQPGFVVSDSRGYARQSADEHAATLDLLDRMVHGVLAELYARGMYAMHASAVATPAGALILAGRSGQGKTTLALGLVRHGFGLLSDEFAVVAPASRQILPYRRSIHIRPGTPALIPELGFIMARPQLHLGGGIEWSLTPDDLALAFPGCLAAPAPLCAVLLLDGGPQPTATPLITPIPGALATLELLRGTWAASLDFSAGLARLGRLLDGVPCARLRAGALGPTVDTIAHWLGARHD